MKTIQIIAVAVLAIGCGSVLPVTRAQAPGIKRTDLRTERQIQKLLVEE